MSSRRDNRQEDARLRVMLLISKNSSLSSRQIAEKVGVSNGSAYYILNALLKKGFIKLENFKANPKKRSYSYLLTPEGIHEKSVLTFRFIKRKKQEFEALREEINLLEKEAKVDSIPNAYMIKKYID